MPSEQRRRIAPDERSGAYRCLDMVEAIVGRLASILIHMLISQDVRNECKQ